jgi:hypothetical protein
MPAVAGVVITNLHQVVVAVVAAKVAEVTAEATL